MNLRKQKKQLSPTLNHARPALNIKIKKHGSLVVADMNNSQDSDLSPKLLAPTKNVIKLDLSKQNSE